MLRKLLFLAAGTTALAACASSDEPTLVTAETSTLAPRIINGIDSTDAQDAAVMLYWLDTTLGRLGAICTATLVAPNLVITARHCVAVTPDQTSCNADGTPLEGGGVGELHNPQDLYIFTGKNRAPFVGDDPPQLDTTKWQPAGRGKQVLDDGSSNICNHDIAMILLENPIANVPIASMQLDGQPAVSEKVVSVGWGVTVPQAEPAVRQQRANVKVTGNGPSEAQPFVLTPSEFLFDESICSGDSGGPIYVQSTGALLGVASRGSNLLDPDQGGPSYTCTNASNIGTKLAPFKAFITKSFAIAGATPKVTAPPDDDSSCHVVAPGAPARDGAGIAGLAVALAALMRRARRA